MRFGWVALTGFLVLLFLGCAHQSARMPASEMEPRAYELSGRHPQFGPYSGTLELRFLDREAVEATRIVTYRDYRFEEMKVQEVWQANGTLSGDSLRVSFALKRADLFSAVDGARRTAEQFRAPLTIEYRADLRNGLGNFAETQESIGRARFLSADSVTGWKNERKFLPSMGNSHPVSGAAAMLSLFAPVMNAYRKDPVVQSYANRPEYKSRKQYFIFDPTDFEFLRAHPDTVRVANKVVDPISLVEASMRRDAYAPSLAEKAKKFDHEFSEYHLNELGLYSGAVFDASGKLTGYSVNGDGCLWTGMYAGSQAMRWLVTKEPKALENFRRAIKGLMLLLDLTGSESEFARSAELYVEGETLVLPMRRANAPFAHVKYVEGGNNDMVKGIFYGLAWAYEILPANDPLLAEVSAHAVKLPKLRVAKEIQRVGNKFLATGLAAIAAGSTSAQKEYVKSFGLAVKPTNDLSVNSGFYYGGIADWSGINLSMVSQVAQILVAKQVAKKFSGEKSPYGDLFILRELRQNLLNTWATYATARRGFLTIAADTFAIGNALRLPDEAAPKYFPKSELWAGEIEQAVWLLREVPALRYAHSISYDFTLRPDWSLSFWPLLPWKYWGENTSISRYYQGAYEFPIFENKATESENYWKAAFEFRGGGSANNRHGRIDYLNVYWMGRLSGLLDEKK